MLVDPDLGMLGGGIDSQVTVEVTDSDFGNDLLINETNLPNDVVQEVGGNPEPFNFGDGVTFRCDALQGCL